MKKRLLCVWIAALLILALLPAAALADSEVTLDLGRVRAGEYMNVALATVGTGSGWASIESGSLPDNCSIASTSYDGGTAYSLSGTPGIAGVYSFTVKITEEIQNPAAGNEAPGEGEDPTPPDEGAPGEDEPLPPPEPITIISVTTVHATITVLPALPTVEVRDAECFVGESIWLTADARTSDSGTLRYQWYFNPVRDNRDGQPLQNQTGRDMLLGAEFVGESYYYCVVTNENNGYTESVASPVITLTVKEPTITKVSLATWPTKLDYTEGEKLDTSGLTLLIEFSNGSVLTESSGFSAGPTELNTVGTQVITVKYQDFTVNYTVNVKEEREVPKSLYVAKMPSKFSYRVGDQLDTSGLVLEMVTNKGNKSTVTWGFSCSPQVLNTAGTQTITVSYEGLTTEFNVIVSNSGAEKTVQRIRVETEPDKMSYQVGEDFDSSGMVLRVTTDQDESFVRSGFTCSPTSFSTAGTQIVTVFYGGQSCTLSVTVSEKPTGGGTDSGRDRRDYDDDDEEEIDYGRKKNAGNNLLAVIMIAAVLALTTLFILLYVSRRDKARAARARAVRRRYEEESELFDDFK